MMNLQVHSYLSVFCLAATFVAPSFAQIASINQEFQWKFINNFVSQSRPTLPTCKPMPIKVSALESINNGTTGTPPYYLMVLPLNSTPMTTFIGTNASRLNWNVTLPTGSEMGLAVMDSEGNFGGSQPAIWTVNAGTSTDCIPPPDSSPPFTVAANVTDNLESCQPWGLTAKGGVPPYTVTILQLDPAAIMNVTMPVQDDRFTYINITSPATKLIAAVSDSTGRWANGTPSVNTINTKGLANTQCMGSSSSGNNTLVQQTIDSAQASAAAEKARRSLTVGLSVTALIFVLTGLGILGFIYLRRWQVRRRRLLSSATPHQFTDGQLLPVQNSRHDIEFMGGSIERPPVVRGRLALGSLPAYHRDPHRPSEYSSPGESTHQTNDFGVSVNLDEATIGSPMSQYTVSCDIHTRGFASFPTLSTRRSAKSIEAGVSSVITAPNSDYAPETAISDNSNVLGQHVSPTRVAVFPSDEAPTARGMDQEVPQELPPPYAI